MPSASGKGYIGLGIVKLGKVRSMRTRGTLMLRKFFKLVFKCLGIGSILGIVVDNS